jgi:hypothetical protein
MTKALIFDSGALINLSMNGLLYILEPLKKNFSGRFLITKQVKYEVVDRPIGIKKFELGAVRVQSLIDSGLLEMSSSSGVSDESISAKTKEFMQKSNHSLTYKGNWMDVVSEAEMSCLALSEELTEKGTECMIAIDERTTRMLCEDPKKLAEIMSNKLHQKIKISSKSFSQGDFNFIRSSELVFVAYKKGFIDLPGKQALDALLYATKFKGSSISFEEIEQLKKL